MKIFREDNDNCMSNVNFKKLNQGEICIVTRNYGYNRNTFELVRKLDGELLVWGERFHNLKKAVNKSRFLEGQLHG